MALTKQGSNLVRGYDLDDIINSLGEDTDISAYVAGDILYASAANKLSRLAKGSDTEVLTLSGGVPTWAAAGGGGGVTLTDSNQIINATDNANFIFGVTQDGTGDIFEFRGTAEANDVYVNMDRYGTVSINTWKAAGNLLEVIQSGTKFAVETGGLTVGAGVIRSTGSKMNFQVGGALVTAQFKSLSLGAAYATASVTGEIATSSNQDMFLNPNGTGTLVLGAASTAETTNVVDIAINTEYSWAMGDSAKDPTTEAPADWVQITIGGTTYYLPAYAA
jgi:hypothetical protein